MTFSIKKCTLARNVNNIHSMVRNATCKIDCEVLKKMSRNLCFVGEFASGPSFSDLAQKKYTV